MGGFHGVMKFHDTQHMEGDCDQQINTCHQAEYSGEGLHPAFLEPVTSQ